MYLMFSSASIMCFQFRCCYHCHIMCSGHIHIRMGAESRGNERYLVCFTTERHRLGNRTFSLTVTVDLRYLVRKIVLRIPVSFYLFEPKGGNGTILNVTAV